VVAVNDLYTNDLSTLVQRLGQTLSAVGYKLVTAESCTGGGIAKICTEFAGSSAWFECGWVTYSNQSKQDLLGVSPQILFEHGAVSEATVMAMAQGALNRSQAQVAIAVSGIAGPDGGTASKPVGMVCIAVVIKARFAQAQTYYFQGQRAQVREQAIFEALQWVEHLLTQEP
jgi:nicotinamide-nucleotide amidase